MGGSGDKQTTKDEQRVKAYGSNNKRGGKKLYRLTSPLVHNVGGGLALAMLFHFSFFHIFFQNNEYNMTECIGHNLT